MFHPRPAIPPKIPLPLTKPRSVSFSQCPSSLPSSITLIHSSTSRPRYHHYPRHAPRIHPRLKYSTLQPSLPGPPLLCPKCRIIFTTEYNRDEHYFVVHILGVPDVEDGEDGEEVKALIAKDQGNFDGPLGLGRHVLSPEFFCEEPESYFDSPEETWDPEVTEKVNEFVKEKGKIEERKEEAKKESVRCVFWEECGERNEENAKSRDESGRDEVNSMCLEMELLWLFRAIGVVDVK